MKIIRPACAGTLESGDAYVEVLPGGGKIELNIESKVLEQFGDEIRASAEAVIAELNVGGADIHIIDQGALDCVIRARLETALKRGGDA